MTRVELLRAIADSIEMQEKAGIEPVFNHRYHGNKNFEIKNCNFEDDGSRYIFPIAVIEGQTVYAGDIIYTGCGHAMIAARVEYIEMYEGEGDCFMTADGLWIEEVCLATLTGHPKTLMVEMPFEKVVRYSKMESDIGDACRKAIDKYEA